MTDFNGWKYKRKVLEFHEFLINYLTSRDIINDERKYTVICYLLKKYEEYFNTYDL